MGVKERKERDKADMRERILQSAHKIFVSKGFDEVSIRNIADDIEYSPATIYLYFKDKNEIYYGLQTEAFKVFNAFIADIILRPTAIERLVAAGQKYMDFALKYPKYYEIMFITRSPMDCHLNRDKWVEGAKAHELLEALIAQCQAAGHFKNYNNRQLALTVWSFIHGLCSLELQNRLRIYTDEELPTIKQETFNQFVQMLKTL